MQTHKKTIKQSLLAKVLLIVLIFSGFLSTFQQKVYAQGTETLAGGACGGLVTAAAGSVPVLSSVVLGMCSFQNAKFLYPNLDILRTTVDMFISAATEIPSMLVWGKSLNQQQACTIWGINYLGGNISPPEDLKGLATDANCDYMAYCPQCGTASNLPGLSFRGSSLAGLLVTTTAITETGPMPSMNLANYGKHVASNTLILKDTALAQTYSIESINSVVSAITKVWELLRNISYGLLAIFMIYVGAMIMMRKQISSQVVVTAQYAIPRIIISIVLITFSMAIGLLGIGLIRPIQLALIEPIRNMYAGSQGAGPVLTAALISGSFYQVGVGVVFILLGAIIGFINIALWIAIGVKYIFIFLKLYAATVTAPLTFAWGSIPGNEESIYDWFKYFLANMLALPAMAVTMEIGNYVMHQLLINQITSVFEQTPQNKASAYMLFADTNMSVMFGVLISIFIFIQALKMPNKIEEAVMGPKKKK